MVERESEGKQEAVYFCTVETGKCKQVRHVKVKCKCIVGV